MKKLIGVCLSLALIIGAAAVTFAQEKQDTQKQDGKGTAGKGDDGSKGKGHHEGQGHVEIKLGEISRVPPEMTSGGIPSKQSACRPFASFRAGDSSANDELRMKR